MSWQDGWHRGATIGWWDKMYPNDCYANIVTEKIEDGGFIFEWKLVVQTLVTDPEGEDYLELAELDTGEAYSLEEAQKAVDAAYRDAVVNP